MNDKEFKFMADTEDSVRAHFDLVESPGDVARLAGELDAESRAPTPGSVVLKPHVLAGARLPVSFEFRVSVRDTTRPAYDPQVSRVLVHIRAVTEDMVANSGSLRLTGITAERLVETRYAPPALMLAMALEAASSTTPPPPPAEAVKRSMLDELQAYLALHVFRLPSAAHLDVSFFTWETYFYFCVTRELSE